MLSRLISPEMFPSLNLGSRGVFTPTGTTRAILEAANRLVTPGTSVLDLGCGSGVLGIELLLRGHKDLKLSMSDLSLDAVTAASKNFEICKFDAVIKHGSLFEPWLGQLFDCIISDVSGVIPKLGEFFNWFDEVPNDSGGDGTALAIAVLNQAHQHLKKDGMLIFPIISLSDENKILKETQIHFHEVEIFSENRFPLGPASDELKEKLANFSNIRVDELAGTLIFYTRIIVAKKPKEHK